MEILNKIMELPDYFQSVGPFITFLVVVLESILPILPISVIIAFAVLSYGFMVGFGISYIGTIVGCILSFLLTRYLFKTLLYNHISKNGLTKAFMEKFGDLSLGSVVVLMAMPFSPAFLLNICGGLSKMSFKKFVIALFIAKCSIVYFWGFIGTNFVESLTNPVVLIKVLLMLCVSYILSKLVDKKFSIK